MTENTDDQGHERRKTSFRPQIADAHLDYAQRVFDMIHRIYLAALDEYTKGRAEVPPMPLERRLTDAINGVGQPVLGALAVEVRRHGVDGHVTTPCAGSTGSWPGRSGGGRS